MNDVVVSEEMIQALRQALRRAGGLTYPDWILRRCVESILRFVPDPSPDASLDDVLAEIKAMGWDRFAFNEYPTGWVFDARNGQDDPIERKHRAGDGDTPLAAAISLRDALRQRQDGGVR